MELGNLIKNLRKEAGWSQEKLAKETNVSVFTINRIENNKRVPSKKLVQRIFSALGQNDDNKLFARAKVDLETIFKEFPEQTIRWARLKMNRRFKINGNITAGKQSRNNSKG